MAAPNETAPDGRQMTDEERVRELNACVALLKPCPFCGTGTTKIGPPDGLTVEQEGSLFSVYCYACEYSGPAAGVMGWNGGLDAAIAAWNRRANATPTASALKPCPCCGSATAPVAIHGLPEGEQACVVCDCSEGGCGLSKESDNIADAVAVWNRRPPPVVATAHGGVVPCPFCGAIPFNAYEREAGGGVWAVECPLESCGSCGPDRPTRQEAIAAWNRAAPR